jgi:hypothetical protein
MFERLSDAELAADPCVEVMRTYTEEGKKVGGCVQREGASIGIAFSYFAALAVFVTHRSSDCRKQSTTQCSGVSQMRYASCFRRHLGSCRSEERSRHTRPLILTGG